MKRVLLLVLVLMGLQIFAGAARAEMVLRSDDIQDGGTLPMAQVFNSFGCEGGNMSPHLAWDGVPAAAKSLAVTVYDPDAPTGSGWWHWVAFNIPADVRALESGASGQAMPEGTVESVTDYGATGFGGACPPVGDDPHRYIVTLHALDVDSLPIDEKASGAMVGYYLGAHGLDTATITATYGRAD